MPECKAAASAETVDTDHLGHGNYQLGNGKMFEGKKYLTGGAGGVLSLFCDLDSGAGDGWAGYTARNGKHIE